MKTTKYIYSYLILLFTLLFSQTSFAHFGSKGPFGGTVNCVASNDSIVYIGTLNGGVFESTTNALTAWRARPVGLTSGKINALVHSKSYLFAGTDSGVFIFNGFVGSDRYWNKINTGLTNLKITALLALDSITVLAGTDGSGLFLTTNKGTSWSQVNNPNLSNAAISGIIKAGNRLFLLSKNQGVFKSDDNGLTWTDFNDANTLNIGNANILSYNGTNDVLLVSNANGLFTLSNASTATTTAYTSVQSGIPTSATIKSITNTSANWYVATSNGIYASPVTAINWTGINNGLPSSNITAIIAVQNRLIAGIATHGIYKATAGTYAWSALNTNFNNPVTRTMAAAGDSLVIAVTDQGVYVSKNLATSYVRSNSGLNDSANINDIIVADICFIAATSNAGVFFTADSGKTWTQINDGLSNLNIKKLFYATHHKYAIDADGKIFSSTLHASSWDEFQDGLPANVKPTSLSFYAGKLILGTLGHGVFVSEQHHAEWTAANTGLSNLNVTSVTASGNKIFAGTDGSGVFVSDFATINWQQTSPTAISHTNLIGLNGNKIQAMASYAGYVYASYKGGLLATSDNGQTWQAGGNQFNLPSFTDVNKICFVNTRVFVPTENNAVYSNALSELPALPDTLILSETVIDVAAAPEEEVTISLTSNRTWVASVNQNWVTLGATSGNRNTDVALGFLNNTGAPRSATITFTAGNVIRTITVNQDGGTGLSKNTLNASVLSIYPNPSNGSFTVKFDGINARNIKLIDITGKTIEIRRLSGNSQSETFELPQGLYFIQLEAIEGTVTRKVLVK